jgi:hypothetical protein
MDEHGAVCPICLPKMRNHPAGEPKHLAGLLETRIFAKPGEQLMKTWVERVALRNLLRPPFVRPRDYPLLNRRAKGLCVGLTDGASIPLIGHAFKEAAPEDGVEFDTVETNGCDV